MSKKTLALIVILVIVTAFLIAAAISPPAQQPVPPQQPKQTVRPTVSPAQTTLALSPSPLVLEKGASTSALSVNIDSATNRLTAVQLELSYNPAAINVLDIQASTFFTNPVVLLKSIDRKEGKISFAIGISPSGQAQQGAGSVATITFAAKSSTIPQTTVSFLPKTLVTAEGVTTSVLKSSTGATVVLSQ